MILMLNEETEKLIMAKELCKLSKRIFAVRTLEGVLTVIIDGDEEIENDYEYDIKKWVKIIKEDNNIFSIIKYQNWNSLKSNCGGEYLHEVIPQEADENHPQGYNLNIEHLEKREWIDFKIGENSYYIYPNSVFINNNYFNIINNIFRFKINKQYTIGFNMESRTIIGIFKKDDKEEEIKIEELVKYISEEDLATIVNFMNRVIKVYNQNKNLLGKYHSKETIVSIIETANLNPDKDTNIHSNIL